jgi:hypothetical protein
MGFNVYINTEKKIDNVIPAVQGHLVRQYRLSDLAILEVPYHRSHPEDRLHPVTTISKPFGFCINNFIKS